MEVNNSGYIITEVTDDLTISKIIICVNGFEGVGEIHENEIHRAIIEKILESMVREGRLMKKNFSKNLNENIYKTVLMLSFSESVFEIEDEIFLEAYLNNYLRSQFNFCEQALRESANVILLKKKICSELYKIKTNSIRYIKSYKIEIKTS